MNTPYGDVSRETSLQLAKFEELLLKWNTTLNLIGASTASEIATRHIRESLLLLQIVPPSGMCLDLGTGAGFPGVPMCMASNGHLHMTLVESDRRKCEFLRAVRRELDLDYQIIAERSEDIPSVGADIIVSRAMASLAVLLKQCVRHGHSATVSAFPKGRSWREEVAEARRTWSFDLETSHDGSEPGSAMLRIENVRPL